MYCLAICIGVGGFERADTRSLFDPKVFYQDGERRKTVGLRAFGFIFRGQERPTGCKNSLREDLMNQMQTGEGTTGRLPYAFLTHMVKLIGWKRIALNKRFRFKDIDDSQFGSIVRSCAVIRLLVKCVDPLYLQHNYNALAHEQYGIFAREADAGVLLACPPGVLAGLTSQHAFAEEQ